MNVKANEDIFTGSVMKASAGFGAKGDKRKH